MNKKVKKFLKIVAVVLLLGGLVAFNKPNVTVSARSQYRNNRIRRGHRNSNKVSYRTYKYTLKKISQNRRNAKKVRQNLKHYRDLLRSKRSKRVTRKDIRNERYWDRRLTKLNQNRLLYQQIIHQYNSKKHHKRPLVDATHKYVLSTKDLISNNNLRRILGDRSYTYGGGRIGTLVHIVAKKQVAGKTFDYIKAPGHYDNDQWIYSGDLGNNPKASVSSINLSRLESDLHSKYVDHHAAKFLRQMKMESFKFINEARRQYGRRPITENSKMDQLASLRARQLISRYSHRTREGQPYIELDASRFNILMTPGWGENIAWDYAIPKARQKTDPTVYNQSNGKGMAYAANNNMLNWDAHSHWGHRHNMLNPHADLVGLGSAYNPKTEKFYLAEDFYKNPTVVPYK